MGIPSLECRWLTKFGLRFSVTQRQHQNGVVPNILGHRWGITHWSPMAVKELAPLAKQLTVVPMAKRFVNACAQTLLKRMHTEHVHFGQDTVAIHDAIARTHTHTPTHTHTHTHFDTHSRTNSHKNTITQEHTHTHTHAHPPPPMGLTSPSRTRQLPETVRSNDPDKIASESPTLKHLL